ncbi:MAG: phage shock protein operon transcriptional activator [Xanthomonadales bacterium]|jgi:psp operon transcriptional activator|nr:phage shock protein operon transcriptional activator [Xanthomonadales bacterium]
MADPRDQAPLGSAPAFLEALDAVSRVAPLDRPVLVIGERGTGKELVAARLHYLSRRWDRPFLQLNCATLTETLLETELFGHEAGAFTGAQRRHQGRFELAHQGTLFLDEIATASLRVQEKLLRVIEYGSFERVGGRETIEVDVRIVAATNVDLPDLARNGQFREDLLDRLAFEVITLPPLRARREDILPLAEHFATRMTQSLKRSYFAGFAVEAEALLLGHDWPGNIRELKNVVERAVYRNQDAEEPVTQIQLDPFASPWRPGKRSDPRAAPVPALDSPPEPALRGRSARAEAVESIDAPPLDGPLALEDAVQAYEVSMLRRALAVNRYHQRRAADWLGLSYHQLRGYLRKYRLTGNSSESEVEAEG